MKNLNNFKEFFSNIPRSIEIKIKCGAYEKSLHLLQGEDSLPSSFYRFMLYGLTNNIEKAIQEVLSWDTLGIKKYSKGIHIWGGRPIISYKYWSLALKKQDIPSETITPAVFSINNRDDFDYLYQDFLPEFFLGSTETPRLIPYFVFFYVALYAESLNISYYGFSLSQTSLVNHEAQIYKSLSIKTLITPYGSDFYMYSKLWDIHEKDGLLRSYPALGRFEAPVEARVRYWNTHADFIWGSFMTICGSSRHDNVVMNPLCIDVELWHSNRTYSDSDGSFDKPPVTILHAPNHKGVKGSDVILDVISRLQDNYNIKLIIVQNEKNETIRYLMQSVDIAIDQLILNGYGMFSIEAMSSGVPTIANISNPNLDLFRLRSYLLECPIVSADQYSFAQVIQTLICRPELRKALGKKGRIYTEKYHSFSYYRKIFKEALTSIDSSEKIKSEHNPDFYNYVDNRFIASLQKVIMQYSAKTGDKTYNKLLPFIESEYIMKGESK